MAEESTPRPLAEPARTGDDRLDALARLLAIVDRLRAPDGCPWDLEQTVASMAPSLVEEAFEAVEAIDRISVRGDDDAVEELGDLLMVITLITRIAADEERFDLAAVARTVGDKLVRRHPHVFGDVEVTGSEHAVANWEKIKQGERRDKREDASALAGVPVSMPALQRADRMAAKAISAGFRWSDVAGAFRKLAEEVDELQAEIDAPDSDQRHARMEAELGDVLLAGAFLGRYLEIDPEAAARRSLARFEKRFRRMESNLGERLRAAPLDELIAAWKVAKAETEGAG